MYQQYQQPGYPAQQPQAQPQQQYGMQYPGKQRPQTVAVLALLWHLTLWALVPECVGPLRVPSGCGSGKDWHESKLTS